MSTFHFKIKVRIEEIPRQKIIPAPLPFDCGESDSHLDCSFFFTQKCSGFGALLIHYTNVYTYTKGFVAISLAENFEHELFCKLAEQ